MTGNQPVNYYEWRNTSQTKGKMSISRGTLLMNSMEKGSWLLLLRIGWFPLQALMSVGEFRYNPPGDEWKVLETV